MSGAEGVQWAKETITSRVSISKQTSRIKISIKAEAFVLGNNFLTFCISTGFLGEFILGYLLLSGISNPVIIIPAFLVLGAILTLAVGKIWLWHHFGEEHLQINGNFIEVFRNYGLYSSRIEKIELDNKADIYTNKIDKWNWIEFRLKGMLRIKNKEEKFVDFGIALNHQEFEMIITPLNQQLAFIKKRNTSPGMTSAKNAIKEGLEEKGDTIVQPSLEEQTDGNHLKDLENYLNHTQGKEVQIK